MRLDPTVQQVERKIVYTTAFAGQGDILAMPIVPSKAQGYGTTLVLTRDKLMRLSGTSITTGLTYDSTYRRWSTFLYNGCIYYTNELNPIRYTDAARDIALANAPSGRYVGVWYDHVIVGAPTFEGNNYPDGVMWSHLYDFETWHPDATNEADYYEFVEWQLSDFPYTGVTGMGRIGSLWWVYTPTCIVPMRYVGLKGGNGIEVVDELVLTRIGNTFPWTMVPLDRVHFFFDAIEKNFFAFDGQQPVPIGEPVRQYMIDNLNTDPALAAKMWGAVDVVKREIWWRFVSTASSGAYDKAVVFNYRTKNWFTASTENVSAFTGSMYQQGKVADLTSTVASLGAVPVSSLGKLGSQIPRLYGGASGAVYRDELVGDATSSLLTADNPVLESGDFLYGSLHSQKEVRAVAVNAGWDAVRDATMTLEVGVSTRDYLDDTVNWTDVNNTVGNWTRSLPEGRLTHQYKTGKAVRFRFLAKNSRGLRFTAYEPTIYSRGAEQ
jgi:hypothetical protein